MMALVLRRPTCHSGGEWKAQQEQPGEEEPIIDGAARLALPASLCVVENDGLWLLVCFEPTSETN